MQDLRLEVDWRKCVVACTDGAASMVGCHSGVSSKIRKVTNKNLLSYTLHNSP